MNMVPKINRRAFVIGTAAAGCMALGINLPFGRALAQAGPDRPQGPDRDRPTVHPDGGSSVGAEFPPHGELRTRLDPSLTQGHRHAGVGDLGDQGHHCPSRTRADEVAVRPPAEREADGVDEEGLACAGLAGHRREPGAELDVGPVDDPDLLDGEAAEHLPEP